MPKRKLDDFLDLAKDLSASEIAEGLLTLGPTKCRRIFSDQKFKDELRDVQARTTEHLYSTFQYFLQQRKWGLNTILEEQNLWVATMQILNMPHRSQVKFLSRDLFLRAFEHAMLTAHQFQALRKLEDADEAINRGLQWPPYPPQAAGYKREHPSYQEAQISYEEWLNTDDRLLEDDTEKCGMVIQELSLEAARAAGQPLIRETPENERQLLLEGVLNGERVGPVKQECLRE